LIEDLLDVTRINRGKIRIDREVVDLAAVLRAAVEDCKGAAERAGARVELELPEARAMVDGDPVRLQQVLGNLIDNAIKFGGAKKPVMVSLSVKDDRSTEVKVKDDGEGIDAAVLARLFVPFSQADTSVQRHRSGLGLGLALVKALVELHGGSVTAFSAGLGHGAEFCVKFPPTR
jgi:two-component system CheB/CheR fusion protein